MLQFFLMRMEVMQPCFSIRAIELRKQTNPSSSENEQSLSSSGRISRFGLDKEKTIRKKADSIRDKLRIQNPGPIGHVVNFLNVLGINEHSLLNNSQESFYKSIFYIKTVEKVEVRKNAVILQLNHTNSPLGLSEPKKVQELINKLSTSGRPHLYQLALQLQETCLKIEGLNFESEVGKSFEGEPLSRYIQRFQDRVYMFKYGSNKLVISRALLELLGEDMQNYALELIKFKTPSREIISNKNYVQVITKSISNIGLLCDFLKQEIDFDTLRDSSVFQFQDHLLTRKQKTIPCKLRLSMITPMVTCLQAVEVSSVSGTLPLEDAFEIEENGRLLDSQIRDLRFREYDSLRNIVLLQGNMLAENRAKVAGYINIHRNTL